MRLALLAVASFFPLSAYAADKELDARIAPLAKDHKGRVAIAVRNLKTGEAYSLNADEVMPTASLIKLPVMVETYWQAAEEKVKLETTLTLKKDDKVQGSGILTQHFSDGATFPLRDAVRLMIVYSDNTATNLVLDQIGIPSTNIRMEKLGLKSTKINAKVFKGSTTSINPEGTKKFGLGSTTANEMVQLLEMIEAGKVVSADACKEMLKHLKACDDKNTIARFLPNGMELAFKTGAVSDARTGAGIAYTKSGPVAFCILTTGNEDKRWSRENAAELLLTNVAREVYEYFGVMKKEPDGKVLPAPGEGKKPEKKGLGTFTIDKKTTYVTGPIDADGHIDYPAALNERLSKGVTIQNNAAVLLWKVIGPHPEKLTMSAKFYELLGIQLPEKGDYFVPLRHYLETTSRAEPEIVATSLETMTRLTQRTWTAKEHPEIHDWLNANEKPLALLIEATDRSLYYSPMVPQRKEKGSLGLLSTLLPNAQLSRQLASALVSRAMLQIGEGKPDLAWKDIMACHRLARLVGRGASLIESLVGISIERTACQAELVYVDKVQPDAKRIEACLRDLKSLPAQAEPADKVELSERFTMLEHTMLIDKQGMWHLNPDGGDKTPKVFGEMVLNGIDWDPALENINKWYDRMAAGMREKDRGERARKMDQFIVDLRKLKPIAGDPHRLAEMLREGKEPAKAKGQVIGDVLVTLMFPAANLVQDGADKTTQAFENVVVAFSLARFQSDNGKYPEKLDALVPKYLPQVPKDMFSGKALIYRTAGNGYLLYSVGVNGKDDGGRGPEDQPPGDDLVVRMPMPVPH